MAVGAASVSALLLVHFVDPGQPGHYPTCPFLAFTGLYCPGCGAMRAIHALTCADLGQALSMNPLTVAVLPFLALSWAGWLYRSVTGRAQRFHPPAWVTIAMLVVVVVFGVLRNLPGFAFLAPGGVPVA